MKHDVSPPLPLSILIIRWFFFLFVGKMRSFATLIRGKRGYVMQLKCPIYGLARIVDCLAHPDFSRESLRHSHFAVMWLVCPIGLKQTTNAIEKNVVSMSAALTSQKPVAKEITLMIYETMQLKTNIHASFCSKWVLGFVTDYDWICKLFRDAAFTWRPSWLKSDLFRVLFQGIWLSEHFLNCKSIILIFFSSSRGKFTLL